MFTRTIFLAAFLQAIPLSAADEQDPKKIFEKNVGEYLKLRTAAVAPASKVPGKADPEAIEAERKISFEAIRQARSGAKTGDIFTPPVKKYFIGVVRQETAGSDKTPAKEVAKTGNPAEEGAAFSPKVNGPYPKAAPLSSVPPTLLAALPRLPKELEYRFVGKHLILLDGAAALIVDYIPNALP